MPPSQQEQVKEIIMHTHLTLQGANPVADFIKLCGDVTFLVPVYIAHGDEPGSSGKLKAVSAVFPMNKMKVMFACTPIHLEALKDWIKHTENDRMFLFEGDAELVEYVEN
jgi:hypothetical protein